MRRPAALSRAFARPAAAPPAARIAAALAAALAALLALAVGAAAAGPAPRVVADVPPVHALVARAMLGIGAPELILPPGASPHGFALRPSQARRLAEADLVIQVGPALTPWMEKAARVLAEDARMLVLLDLPDAPLLRLRGGDDFEAQGHEDGDGDGDGNGDGDDHGDRSGVDPHAWLDPEIARLWLNAIAAALSEADPANAGAYRANAAAGGAEIDALSARVDAILAPARGRPFIVFHDAYGYFERRFDIPAAGAVSLGDGRKPGAARVAAIRRRIVELGAVCVFSEPQFEPRLVEALIEGTGARRGVLDPLGAGLTPGPQLYGALIEGLARALADCLAPDAAAAGR